MSGVQREFDVLGTRTRKFGKRQAVDRAGIDDIATVDRRHEFATDEVIVTRLEAIAFAHEGECILEQIARLG